MIEKPEMIFPCTCMSGGLVVIKRDDIDDMGIDIAFWQFGQVNGKWGWRQRLRSIWQIIKIGHPYTDMVMLDTKVAKHLAHHILYLLDKKKLQDDSKCLVPKIVPGLNLPMVQNVVPGFRDQHGKPI